MAETNRSLSLRTSDLGYRGYHEEDGAYTYVTFVVKNDKYGKNRVVGTVFRTGTYDSDNNLVTQLLDPPDLIQEMETYKMKLGYEVPVRIFKFVVQASHAMKKS